jgi:putative redox protein
MNIKTELLVTADAAIGIEHYRTTIKSANQTIYADEPITNNGTDTGMNPHSLLLSSLGSCTAITLRMYADRKMWLIDEIAVHLEFYRTNEGTRIDRQISFKGDVTEEQYQRLIQIADACPIHKVLTGHIEVITS